MDPLKPGLSLPPIRVPSGPLTRPVPVQPSPDAYVPGALAQTPAQTGPKLESLVELPSAPSESTSLPLQPQKKPAVSPAVPTCLPMELEEEPTTSAPPSAMDQFLKRILEKDQLRQKLGEEEKLYLQRAQGKSHHQDLLRRYGDHRVSPERVHQVHGEFALQRGIDLQQVPEGLAHDNLEAHAHRLVEAFFANPRASLNPEKCQLVKQQTSRSLELLRQAQAEGDAPGDLSAADLYGWMAGNIASLAVQDRAAAEVMLGDHGVRHLVGHNIRVCETMADEIERNGGKVTAKERLMLHQTMIMHDIGYTTQNVRGDLNYNGIQGQDNGHPVLGARYVRERACDANDPLARIFSADELQLVHRCILYHDKDSQGGPGLQFHLSPQPSAQQRAENLESLTRLADNTHAFEDKLPEALYRHPDTLVGLRKMKTAVEIDQPQRAEEFRQQILEQIQERPDLSADDKAAMAMAIATSNPKEMAFLVNRTVGNQPTYRMDEQGKVHLSVEESPIHSGLTQMAGTQRFGLLPGWVKDIAGHKPTELAAGQSRIETEAVAIDLRLASETPAPLTPFQQQLAALCLDDQAFRSWSLQDQSLATTQKAVTALLESAELMSEPQLRQAADLYVEVATNSSRESILQALGQRRQQIQSRRQEIL